MVIKNAAGEKQEVFLGQFFPTHRARIARLLNFFADNVEKRDKYYAYIMKCLTRQYINAGIDIDNLYAERREKARRLHELRKKQDTLLHHRNITNSQSYSEYMTLEEIITQVKHRQVEITTELTRTKLRKERLGQNLHMIVEVKPW